MKKKDCSKCIHKDSWYDGQICALYQIGACVNKSEYKEEKEGLQ